MTPTRRTGGRGICGVGRIRGISLNNNAQANKNRRGGRCNTAGTQESPKTWQKGGRPYSLRSQTKVFAKSDSWQTFGQTNVMGLIICLGLWL